MTAKMPTTKICSKCKTSKNIKDSYYLAANDMVNSDGRLPICKTCLASLVDMKNPESLINAMRLIDRPFLKATYDDSLTHKNPFGEYMRMLATRQNRTLTYLDSSFEGSFSSHKPKSPKDLNKVSKAEEEIAYKISPATILKWGSNYNESELYQLETFYNSMTVANSITTPQHKEQLKLLCKLNLEQNKALDEARINDFKNLNIQYNKILENSGFRPIDKVSGGESIGIRTFSQIWEEIEKDGFIEPYPYEERQDIVDKTIMYMGNYTRKLLNMQSMAEPPDDTPKVEGDYE